MRSRALMFFRDKGGATAIEYSVIAALIALVAIPAMSVVGGSVSDALAEISAKLGSRPDIDCRGC